MLSLISSHTKQTEIPFNLTFDGSYTSGSYMSGTYYYFKSSGTLNISSPKTINYYIIGGAAGGMGGKYSASGTYGGNSGNSGYVLTGSINLSSGNHSVVIGEGGLGSPASATPQVGQSGQPSSLDSLIANGGYCVSGVPTTDGNSTLGSKGVNTQTAGGTGRNGTMLCLPLNLYLGATGGASGRDACPQSLGGSYGAGKSGYSSSINGENGLPNTGSSGGGGRASTISLAQAGKGGDGGSGAVIIWF